MISPKAIGSQTALAPKYLTLIGKSGSNNDKSNPVNCTACSKHQTYGIWLATAKKLMADILKTNNC